MDAGAIAMSAEEREAATAALAEIAVACLRDYAEGVEMSCRTSGLGAPALVALKDGGNPAIYGEGMLRTVAKKPDWPLRDTVNARLDITAFVEECGLTGEIDTDGVVKEIHRTLHAESGCAVYVDRFTTYEIGGRRYCLSEKPAELFMGLTL